MLRDFIVTTEGLIFSVVSYSHPEDRVVAFLRYFPSSSRERERKGEGYQKVSSVEHSFRYLERFHPEYIFNSRRLDARLQAVPLEKVREHLKPRERFKGIVRNPGNKTEEKVKELNNLFPHIPQGRKGITGSVLANLSTPNSDLDFVVYGIGEHNLARKRLRQLFARGEAKEPALEHWEKAYRKRFPHRKELSFREFLFHERRKFHKGLVGGRVFDLLLVDDRREKKPWKSERKEKLGILELRCTVTDARRAFDYPAIYKVLSPEVEEVVSYTHTYAGQAFEGEEIVARGCLERVKGGKRRLVVGTTREAGGEYIRLAEL